MARTLWENSALTLLRLVVGVIMVAHGWQKLTGMEAWTSNVAQLGVPAPEVAAYLAVAGELLGGLGLLVGLLTRLAALGPTFTMITAIVSVHLPHGLFAKDGGFEYPLTILVASLYFVARGAGPFSLDALLARGPAAQERAKLQHRQAAGASAAQERHA